MPEHVLGGRYRLQRPLGHGATATVWRACDTRLDRDAAVKILDPRARADPAALERLRREARSVARLDHDNIVDMYDVDVADDAAYLVMELVDGLSLTEMMARQGRLPVEQAVSIAAQICAALGAAHAAGVVHRDIKPSNILIGPSGVVKVCDFGVALLDRSGDLALTSAGAVVGTCQYMAPEQAAGDPIDGRAHLYAVGCVLYAMLAGAPPFAADHPIDVLDLHLNEPPVPLRAYRDDVPAALHELVDEMLAKHADDRPATAWSVRDRLQAISDATAANATAAAQPTVPLPAIPDRPPAGMHPAKAWPAMPGGAQPTEAWPGMPGRLGRVHPTEMLPVAPDQPGAGVHRPAMSGPTGGAPPTELPAAQGVVHRTAVLPAVPGRPGGVHRTAVFSAAPLVRRWREWPRERALVLVAAVVATAVLATVLVAGLATRDDQPDAPAGPAPVPTLSAEAETAAPTDEPTAEASSEPTASPTPERTTPTTTPAPVTPLQRLAGLAATIQQQADAGRLRPKTAKMLLRSLQGVARELNGGDTAEAAERFAEFRERVGTLRDRGELAGVALPDLGEIAASLRAG